MRPKATKYNSAAFDEGTEKEGENALKFYSNLNS